MDKLVDKDPDNVHIDPFSRSYRPHIYPRARQYECRLAGWRVECSPSMVWDHCHAHGTVRGPLCNRHNQLIEDPDVQGEPELIGHLGTCVGCVEGDTYDPDAEWHRSVGLDQSDTPQGMPL